jgi:hypothetical protein
MSFFKKLFLPYNLVLFAGLSNTFYLIRSSNNYFLIFNIIFSLTLMLGYGANTNFMLPTQPRICPRTYLFSNSITVGVRTHTLVDRNTEITLPHKY